MTTENTLIPDYLDIDYNTAKNTLQTLLASNPVFRDVDYEGANITTIIELIAYLISMNTYYMNMIAKNQYIPTANMYETTHMLSQLGGYNPMGYRSSSTLLELNFNVSACSTSIGTSATSGGEVIIIPEWSEISNGESITNPDTGRTISFVTVSPTTTVPLSAMPSSGINEFFVNILSREGYVVRYDYVGADIVDNKIYLPINTYDYDDDLEDYARTIRVYVEDVEWTRLSDWFESSDEITDAFMFKIDKYGRYYVEFSDTRNVPTSINKLSVYAIISSGVNGNVPRDSINSPVSTFLPLESGGYVPLSCYTVTNPVASIGGSSPESIDEIKSSTLGSLHSQYRNVTKNDYISHLESRADIVQSNVWGEQEQNPSGSVQDYNKVYISLVPSVWNSGTVSASAGSSTSDEEMETLPLSAIAYTTDWTAEISEYLKPRKILTCYEHYVVPELLFFKFKIGLKIKTNYTYTAVKTAVENKLKYYFDSYNRSFNEKISFIDITEYLLDITKSSPTDTFSDVKGLRAVIFRELDIVTYSPDPPDYYTYKTINEYDENNIQYPYYVEEPTSSYDNKLRTVQLGHDQFPMLYVPYDTFSQELN